MNIHIASYIFIHKYNISLTNPDNRPIYVICEISKFTIIILFTMEIIRPSSKHDDNCPSQYIDAPLGVLYK